MADDIRTRTARRRWEPEAQRQRDAEILRLHAAGDHSQRDIARAMRCSLGSVQHVIRRARAAVYAVRDLDAQRDAELEQLENTPTYGMAAAELAELERLRHCGG